MQDGATSSSTEMHTRLVNIQRALDESSIVAITDADGTITYANTAFCKISKYSEEELVGKNHRILKSGHHPPAFYEGMWKTISRGHVWKGEIKNMAKDGTFYWVKTTIVPFFDEHNNIVQYVSIRTDITEQKTLQEELADSRKKISEQLLQLQAIDRQKQDFVSMVSHEMKTPLQPIIGFCQVLKNQKIMGSLSAKQEKVVDTILRNARRLDHLVENIVDIQKIEANQMKFEIKKIDLNEFMGTLHAKLRDIVEQRGIEFVNLTADKISINMDRDRLEQILTNFVLNAMDFVPPHIGRIEICAINNYTDVLFYVRDNGVGISKEKQRELFRKFYQVDTSTTRKHEGAGIGLAICKGIIDACGGSIWVESDAGRGSTFYIRIPKETRELVA